MSGKQRLSVTVDAGLLAAAEAAVKRGAAASLSAWVNDALRLKLDKDQKLRALAAVMRDWEREFGTITEKDMAWAQREARRRASVVRTSRAGEPRGKYGK